VRKRLVNTNNELRNRIYKLREERKRLTVIYKKYQDGKFYREEALKLGYLDKGEKLLFISNVKKDKKVIKKEMQNKKNHAVSTAHLKILWFVVSMVFLFFYFIGKKRYERI